MPNFTLGNNSEYEHTNAFSNRQRRADSMVNIAQQNANTNTNRVNNINPGQIQPTYLGINSPGMNLNTSQFNNNAAGQNKHLGTNNPNNNLANNGMYNASNPYNINYDSSNPNTWGQNNWNPGNWNV